MSLNILAAIASRTSHLASSTSMPGLYLDSCQTLVIGEEGELQVIFKFCTVLWGHLEMRENYEYYFTVPRTFVEDCRNRRYTRISMLWSNGSWESIDQYHMTVWWAQILTHGADSIFYDLRWSSVISFQPIASSYLSQDRNFKTIRDRLKKPAVTSKGPLKWETFQKKGNNETEKGKLDFYKSLNNIGHPNAIWKSVYQSTDCEFTEQ